MDLEMVDNNEFRSNW